MTSPTFMAAAASWRSLRAEYETVREMAYQRAETECSGALLNARGKAARVDPYSLFMGTQARALAYASEELKEHWATYPRMSFLAFERAMVDQGLHTGWD